MRVPALALLLVSASLLTSCDDHKVLSLAPLGGGEWEVGATLMVGWTTKGVGSVRIDLSRDGGATWENLAASVSSSDGPFSWTVTGPASASCLLRLSDAGDPSVYDVSASPFTIADITLVSPDGGETLVAGSATEVVWSAVGGPDSVRIEFSSDDGQAWTTLFATTPNDGSETIQLPGDPSDLCLVRVSGTSGTLSDQSADHFRLVASFAPPVDVTTVIDAYSLGWGDNDNDGDLDLIVCGRPGGYSVSYLKLVVNEGGVLSGPPTDVFENGWTLGPIAWGDYDSDGDLDLVAANRTGFIFRNDDGVLVDTGIDLGEISGGIAWADYDGDGDLDLFLNRRYDFQFLTTVYRNDGVGGFVDLELGIGRSSAIAPADFDGDGDADLAICGVTSGPDITDAEVYRNNDGVFVQVVSLGPNSGGSIAWADFDGDGDLDLAVSGMDFFGSGRTDVYRNNGGTFVDIGASLNGVVDSSVSWGDYDNDGDPDLAVAGRINGTTSYLTKIYRNSGGVFSDSSIVLADARGPLAWGDCDSDGDLDLVVARCAGSDGVVKLYTNNAVVANVPPGPPGGLSAVESGGTLTLSWNAATDAETPPEGLTYNVRVGRSPGKGDVVPAMADAVTGVRLIPANGNASERLFFVVEGLGEGTYHWSVQAVDAGLSGGSWAAEAQAVMSGPALHVTSPNGGETCDPGSVVDITWTSAGDIPEVNIELYRAGSWVTLGAAPNTGSYGWTVEGQPARDCLVRVSDASDGLPSDVSDSAFTIPLFTELHPGFEPATSAELAWGDYDSDGDLDLAIAGSVLVEGSSTRTCRVYRNDDGAFTDIASPFTGIRYGGLAWADYDGDGELELAVTGQSSPTTDGKICEIYDYSGSAFSKVPAPFQGVQFSALAWGDSDNDGDLDLAVSGSYYGATLTYGSWVYRNTASSFTDSFAPLTPVNNCDIAWGDYDNDGDLDLLIAGGWWDGSTAHQETHLYANDGGALSDTETGIIGLANCALAWGDYDADGDLDLAICGSYTIVGSVFVSRIYLNDSGVLTDIVADLPGLGNGSVAWADYDCDGDLDLAIAGGYGTTYLTKLYRNDGGVFVDSGVALEGAGSSSLAWGDYDSDGDLDLALTGVGSSGRVGHVYRNNSLSPSSPPSEPADLAADVTGTGSYEVTFSWSDATDDETPPRGLSYNLRVGTSPDGHDIAAGHADATGRRLIPARGMIQPGASWNEWTLTLPAGTYYWSVQAVDGGLAGGPWAPEQTLVISP